MHNKVKIVLDILVIAIVLTLWFILVDKIKQNDANVKENRKLIIEQTEILKNREILFKTLLHESKDQIEILEKLEARGYKIN